MTMIMVIWMIGDIVDDGDDIKLCEYQALASERPSPQYRRVGWPGSPFQIDDHVDSWLI